MEALIDLFWSKYNRLQAAVDLEDPVAVEALDQEIDPLLQAIFQHQVADPAGMQAQFRFALDLLKVEADDRGCVHRNGHLLQVLVERYLAPQISCAAARAGGEQGGTTTILPSGDSAFLDPALFDKIPERIVVVAPGYRVFYSNDTNAQQMGRPKERLVGLHFAETVGVLHFQRDVKPALDRCLEGESITLTYADQRNDQTVVICCRMSPCFSDARTQIGVLVVMQEMADRRKPRNTGNPS